MAADKTFEIAVLIDIVDRFSNKIDKYLTLLNKVDAETMAVQSKISQLKTLGAVGTVITGFGVAGAAALLKMANAAGQLQTAMMGVQYSMGMTQQQTAALTNEVMTTGIPTIFSASQVSGIAASMARSGLPNYSSIQSLLPLYTNFADVQAQLKGENANDVTSVATTMAHAYQLYTSSQLSPFLETLNSMLLHSNETATMVGTEWKYTSGVSKLLGQSPEEALSTLAFANRLGLGFGRGGQDIAEFMQHLIPGAQGGTMSIAAMQAAGFVDANGKSVFTNQQGNFIGWQQTIQILTDWANRMGNNASTMLPMLNAVFGQAGGKLAMRLMSPGADQLYNQTLDQIHGTASINTLQQQLNKTLMGQEKQFGTTIQDIGIALSSNGVINPLTKVLEIVNKLLSTILHFTQTHPVIDRLIGALAMLATTAAMIIGPMMLVGAAMKAWELVAMLTNLGKMVELFGSLGAALIEFTSSTKIASAAMAVFDAVMDANPISLLIIAAAALGAALGALAAAWVKDWGNIREKTKAILADIWKPIQWLIDKVKDVGKMIGLNMAQGLDSSAPAVAAASNNVATQVSDRLELHSPAKKGPLSTLDTWWNSFAPTLLGGLGGDVTSFLSDVAGGGGAVLPSGGEIHFHLNFQPGAIVTSDPKQAGQAIINSFQSGGAQDLVTQLQQAARSHPRGVHPLAN